MNRFIKFGSLVLIFCLSVSLFYHFQQAQSIKEYKQTIGQLVAKKQQATDQEEELEQTVSKLREEVEQTKKNEVNSGEDTTLQEEFTKTVTSVFQTMYNFTPETFEKRETQLQDKLSSELLNNYFKNDGTKGDSSQVTSKLSSVTLYEKAVQETHMKGIVVARYESKLSNSVWTKGLTLFEVTYDPESKTITNIQSLGNGFTGDMLNE